MMSGSQSESHEKHPVLDGRPYIRRSASQDVSEQKTFIYDHNTTVTYMVLSRLIGPLISVLGAAQITTCSPVAHCINQHRSKRQHYEFRRVQTKVLQAFIAQIYQGRPQSSRRLMRDD
eukprot:scaffold46618_cov17-Prasinocladus_malaysianus.AAC.2